MAQPPPRFSLGTFDVGAILKPKPSGNRLTWHNRLPDFRLEPLMLGPFLSQKPSGNRLTWHNRLPDILLEPLMLGPFLSQNQPEPSGNRLSYEPPPRLSVGTFDVGTILKREPSGNRLPYEPPPGYSLGTFDFGTILKPKPSGNRLTWHNRLPDFLLEPLMLEPFWSQNLQETASHTNHLPDFLSEPLMLGPFLSQKPSGNRLTWHNRLPDFLLEPLMLGPFLSQNQPEPSGNRLPYEPPPGFSLGTFDVGTIRKPKPSGIRLTWHNRLPDFLLEPLMLGQFLNIIKPEPSGNRLPYEPPPRFSLGTFDVGTILKPSGNRFLMIFFGHGWAVGFSQIQPPTLGVYSGGSLTYPFFSGSFFLTWHPSQGSVQAIIFFKSWTSEPPRRNKKSSFGKKHQSFDLDMLVTLGSFW